METAYVQRICLINQERVYASFRVESFSNFYNQSIILFISKYNSRNKMIFLEIYSFKLCKNVLVSYLFSTRWL